MLNFPIFSKRLAKKNIAHFRTFHVSQVLSHVFLNRYCLILPLP